MGTLTDLAKIAICSLALILAIGCSVKTDQAGGVIAPEIESDGGALFEPGADDGVIVDAGGTDVVAEGDEGSGEAASPEEISPVDITTEPAAFPGSAALGEEYKGGDGVFIDAAGGSLDKYNWSAGGLPDGIVLDPVAGGKRAWFGGIPAEIGLFNINITAEDPNDPANKDSLSFQVDVDAPEPDVPPDMGQGDCSIPLSVEFKEVDGDPVPANQAGEVIYKDDVGLGRIDEGKFKINDQNVRLKISGGRGPYTVVANSRVRDSFHRVNYGTGNYGGNPRIHQMKGITNYKYWDPNDPCITPEEFQDIYSKKDYAGEYWPDCSRWFQLTLDEREICEKIGCSRDDWPTGAYGSEEYKRQQQCINGFECPPRSSTLFMLLTEGQQEACEEFEAWKLFETKKEENYGTPDYVCSWTRNPTWHVKGKPAPEPPKSQWEEQMGGIEGESSLGFRMGPANVATVGSATSGASVEYVSTTEYDGPLPVDRSSYRTNNMDDISKLPVEEVTFTIRDSCTPQNFALKIVQFGLRYPDEPIERLEAKMVYEDMYLHQVKNLEEAGHSFTLELLFRNIAATEDEAWNEIEEGSLGKAVFNLTEIPNCLTIKDDDNSLKKLIEFIDDLVPGDLVKFEDEIKHNKHKENDKFCSEEVDAYAVKGGTINSVVKIYLSLFAGYQAETQLARPLDFEFGSQANLWLGDLDIEDISIRSNYWYVHYNDSDNDDAFNNDVSGYTPRRMILSGQDGMDNPAYIPPPSQAESQPAEPLTIVFHRRPLIPGPWTFK